MLTRLFSSKFVDRRRFRETTTEMVSLHGSRHGASVGMLRETKGLEEEGLGVANLPLLAESIRILNDCFTVTRNHASLSKVAHETDTVMKVLTLALLNQDRNEILVSLELDTLATTQMHFKDMLLVGGLRMREGESCQLGRQVSLQHTVEPVDSLALDFENVRANTERGTGNVRHVMVDFRADVHGKTRAGVELCILKKHEVTGSVEIVILSAPGFEVRVAIGTCTLGGGGGGEVFSNPQTHPRLIISSGSEKFGSDMLIAAVGHDFGGGIVIVRRDPETCESNGVLEMHLTRHTVIINTGASAIPCCLCLRCLLRLC
jgi:hypothetical protein